MKSKLVVREPSTRRFLFVEGKNDKHVLWSILEYHKVSQMFGIESKEGVDKLLEAFEVAIDESELERLGIIIDADVDIDARWQAIRTILLVHHYNNVPVNPDPNGTIVQQEGLPMVGIWIMPNNKIPGYLEDFVSFLVPQGNVLWPMTDEAIQKVKLVEAGVRFKDVHESKARIHTWLAWQEEPGKPMGQAITARYLDADVPHVQHLLDWIRRLFIS